MTLVANTWGGKAGPPAGGWNGRTNPSTRLRVPPKLKCR